MIQNLSALLIIVLLSVSTAYAQEKKAPAQYWEETGLKLEHLQKDLIEQCYKDSEYFRACIKVINALAGSIEKDAGIYASKAEKDAQHPLLGELVSKGPGALNLYKPKKVEPKDLAEAYEIQRNAKKIQNAALPALFANPKKIDFVTLQNDLLKKVLVGKRANEESLVAAQLYSIALPIIRRDAHVWIAPTEQLEESMQNPNESFFGIGAVITQKAKITSIERVVENSPAQKAGLKRMDVILAINDVSTEGKELTDIISGIKGKENTQVVLKVKRKDQELTLTITRGKVETKNVEYSIINHTGTPYGLIKLRSFMDPKAHLTIEYAIKVLTVQGAKGLILDLRGNGGGLLDQAVKISALFLGKKEIVSVRNLETGQVVSRLFGRTDAVTDLPLVTLIDAGSASASEVVSGALEDHNRGWIVGDRSFGKGTVQTQLPFQTETFNSDSKIVVTKTIQRFHQPSGRTNQISGIIPNFLVDPIPNATESDRFAPREEDEFDGALPAIVKAWSEPRPEVVKAINDCRTKIAVADKLYQENLSSDVASPDYRLYAAEDILNCDIATQNITLGNR